MTASPGQAWGVFIRRQRQALRRFDVWVKAGGFEKAYVETVPVEVTNGQLDIKFTQQTENPQINAIEIDKG